MEYSIINSKFTFAKLLNIFVANTHMSLCEKSSYLELFWPVISRILIEYGEYCVSLRI